MSFSQNYQHHEKEGNTTKESFLLRNHHSIPLLSQVVEWRYIGPSLTKDWLKS